MIDPDETNPLWHSVVVGDRLHIIPRWNTSTADPSKKLFDPIVEDIFLSHFCQSGVRYTVRCAKSGNVLTLDAGWFCWESYSATKQERPLI